jgi:hypothetical protein
MITAVAFSDKQLATITRAAETLPLCKFRSALPRGERPRNGAGGRPGYDVSNHAPARGATLVLKLTVDVLDVSIHGSLREPGVSGVGSTPGSTPGSARSNSTGSGNGKNPAAPEPPRDKAEEALRHATTKKPPDMV